MMPVLHPLRLRTALAACLLLFLGGCEDVTVVTVQVESVMVEPNDVRLLPDEEIHFSATPVDAEGGILGGRDIAWSSNAPGVVSVDSTGMAVALGPGSAEIRASTGNASGVATVVVDSPPALGLSTSDLHFGGASGSGLAQVEIVNEGGGEIGGLEVEVEYDAPGGGDWLDWSLSSTSVPSVLTLVADPTDLQPGTYGATVSVASSQLPDAPATLQVTLEVDASPPVLAVTPEAVGFAASEEEEAPAPETVQVTNEGGGTLTGLAAEIHYDAGNEVEWLQVDLEDDSAPTTLLLQVDSDGLEVGVHEAEVHLSSASAPGTSAVVAVRFRLGETPPQIVVGTELIQRSMEEGGSVPSSVTVAVENAGGGTLGDLTGSLVWASGGSEGWVEAVLASSNAPTEVGFIFDDPGLLPGNHLARWELSSPDAINSPVSIDLVLSVSPRPVPGQSELQVAPAEITADGESESVITVILRDARGERIPAGGDEVEIQASAGTLSPVSDLGGGEYRAILTAPTSVGTAEVTASLRGEPLADSTSVTFVPGAPSVETTTIQASPTRITADGSSTSTVTVQLLDRFGNVAETGTHEVELETTAGSLSDVSTGGDGRFIATLTSSTDVETAEITGTLNGETIRDGATVAFVTGAPDPETSEVTVEPTSISIDGSAEVTVRLFDPTGNPIDSGGDAVFLATTLGELDPAAGETESDGTLRSVFTSTEPGTAEVTAYLGEDDTGEVIGTVTIEVTAGAPDAGESTVEAAPETISIGESSTVRVELRDASGNALDTTGEQIWLETTHGALDPQGGTTEDGAFESVLTASEPGTAEVTAYLGEDDTGEVIGTVTIEVTAGAPDAGESTVEVTPDTITTDESATIRVELRDASGNPLNLTGDTIWLETTHGELDPQRDTTEEGVLESTFTASEPGVAEITARLGEDDEDDVIGTVEVEVTVGELDAGGSTVEATPDRITTDESATIRVQLRDASGNALDLTGEAIWLEMASGELDPQGGTTEDGVFESTFTASETGSAVITAYLGEDDEGEVIGTVQVVVTGGEADADESTVEATPETITTDESATIRVELRDAAGNLLDLDGEPIWLETTHGVLEPEGGTTEDGAFESTLTATEPGVAEITAYLGEDDEGEVIGTVEVEVDESDGGTA